MTAIAHKQTNKQKIFKKSNIRELRVGENIKLSPSTQRVHTHRVRYTDKGGGEGPWSFYHGSVIMINPQSKMEILEKVETYLNERNSCNTKQG